MDVAVTLLPITERCVWSPLLLAFIVLAPFRGQAGMLLPVNSSAHCSSHWWPTVEQQKSQLCQMPMENSLSWPGHLLKPQEISLRLCCAPEQMRCWDRSQPATTTGVTWLLRLLIFSYPKISFLVEKETCNFTNSAVNFLMKDNLLQIPVLLT